MESINNILRLQDNKMKEINHILKDIEPERFNILDVMVLIINKSGKLVNCGPDLFFSSEYSQKFVEQLISFKKEDFDFSDDQFTELKKIYLDSRKLKDSEGKLERELNKNHKGKEAILFCVLRGIQEKEFSPSEDDIMNEVKDSFTNMSNIDIKTITNQNDFITMLNEQRKSLNKKIKDVYSGIAKFKLSIKKRIEFILQTQKNLIQLLEGYNLHYSGAIQKNILNKSFIEKYTKNKNIWHTEPNMVTSYFFDDLIYSPLPENIDHMIFIMNSRNQFCTTCQDFFKNKNYITNFYQHFLKDKDVKKLSQLIHDGVSYDDNSYTDLEKQYKKELCDKINKYDTQELIETRGVKLSFFGIAGD